MFKFPLLALLTLLGAAALALLMPIDVIRCTPDRSCVIAHRFAGVYAIDRDKASGLVTACVTEDEQRDSGGHSYWKYQVVVTGSGGSVATWPKSKSMPSNATVRDSMQRYLTTPNGRNYFMVQMEVGIIVPILLVLLAIHFVRLAWPKRL